MQVYIFGAARSSSKLTNEDSQLILENLISGKKVLDWTLHGLKEAGIERDKISFVGGYKVENVIKEYPELHYIINPKWEKTHLIGSLRYALESWKGGDILLAYADTIFRPGVFNSILSKDASIVIGIDKEWKERIPDLDTLEYAEKVILNGEVVKSIGRETISVDHADAQYSGLTFMKADIVKDIIEVLTGNEISDNDSFSDLLARVLEGSNASIQTVNHSGLWSELDSYEDLARFVFGTKAETLERIKPFVSKSIICDQIHFNVKEWEESGTEIVKKIAESFVNQPLIIRSSSLEEDSWDSSQAGAFDSVADVDSGNLKELKSSIELVIEGFRNSGSGSYNPENQVLVQPFIQNVAMSGVAFTKHLEKGSPYFLINYDDISKKTDTVTSGSTADSKSITIYKNSDQVTGDKRLDHIVEALKELEVITGYSSLDVEFVLTEFDELFVVQVRPITTHTGLYEIPNFNNRLEEAKSKVRSRLKSYPHLYGDTTVLADMPDWNPAEMIGISPKPLAVSLYQYLITDSAWRNARAMMGYNNPSPEKLMFCIGGHPLIDVRNSFNNLIPDDLPEKLSEKLLNHYIERLKENPHLHDKVEFEIVITCYTPDIELHIERLEKAGFSDSEINTLKNSLRRLTENAIVGNSLPVNKLIKKTEELNPRRDAILKEYEPSEIPSLIHFLLDDCIENGTIPFSILARYGFIASSMLKGLVKKSAITESEKDDFLNSIQTVASNLVQEMNGVLSGSVELSDFLENYGHLRPGSYDITSASYRENPSYYFPESSRNNDVEIQKSHHEKNFIFSSNTKEKIADEIKNMGMNISVDALLEFIKEATAAREYAKFQFTKNLDSVLELIYELGKVNDINREDLSYLFIDDLLKLNKFTIPQNTSSYLNERIRLGKYWYTESNTIETPQMVIKPSDLDIILHSTAEPNYVSSKKITASLCNLESVKDKSELNGKIILTEGADPGYDWIFLHPIKGLITKYGGAASHMTIRCAEFGLPAAIGCGEEWYDKLKHAKNVELDCSIKKIRILG